MTSIELLSPLSDTPFILQAMLYKFSPVQLTPLTNGLLCGRLQKCLAQMAVTSKCLAEAKQTSIALYSIDCVRKLLLNHGLVNPFIFDRLDEAREAEMKQDTEFWQLPSQVQRVIPTDTVTSTVVLPRVNHRWMDSSSTTRLRTVKLCQLMGMRAE